MKNGVYNTFAVTADGKVYNIANNEHPPNHNHKENLLCKSCKVINAYLEMVSDGSSEQSTLRN